MRRDLMRSRSVIEIAEREDAAAARDARRR